MAFTRSGVRSPLSPPPKGSQLRAVSVSSPSSAATWLPRKTSWPPVEVASASGFSSGPNRVLHSRAQPRRLKVVGIVVRLCHVCVDKDCSGGSAIATNDGWAETNDALATLAAFPDHGRFSSSAPRRCGVTVECCGLSSRSHGDLPRLGALDLGELEAQHAIREVGIDLGLVDRLRQRELAEERAGLILSQHVALGGGHG